MSDVLHGVIHGKTIELESDPGIEDGRRVEIVLRVKGRPSPPPGWRPNGTETSAGMLADIPGLDEDLDEILRDRKRDSRRGIDE
jgi:hypothetical protein